MDTKRTFDVGEVMVSPKHSNATAIDRHLDQARPLRAEAVVGVFAGALPAASRQARALGARLAGWERQRQTREALMRCSDRVLADIGIAREDIPLIAKGIDPRERDAGRTGWRGWWHRTRARLDEAQARRLQQRRVYGELVAYRDHELDDLGIRRADIPAIARGELPAAA